MVNKHWNLVSTCLLVIIIIYVGYAPITAAQFAPSINGICTSDNAKESPNVVVSVNAKEWAPSGPKMPVQVVAKGSHIKSIQIWTETVDNKNHIGSWTLIPGYKYTYCGIGMSTMASNIDLNLPKITYEWEPPRVNNDPIQLIPSQGTPSQGTPSQVTPTPSPGTPYQNASNQEESLDLEPSNQGTPSEMTSPTPSGFSSKKYKDNKRSLIARQGTADNPTPSYGPIVFKGVLQFENDPALYSFKSGIIPISKVPIPITNGTTDNQNHATSSIGPVESEYPKNPSFSAANSKFIFKGFNLFFILTLSVILVTL